MPNQRPPVTARPPRDRHADRHGTGDPRAHRPDRDRFGPREGEPFVRRGEREPFPRRPFTAGVGAEPVHTVRLRDGDRELEVVGSPGFVRQILDDLPALMGRLRGEAAARPASISMPRAPSGPPAARPERDEEEVAVPAVRAAGDRGGRSGRPSDEDAVLGVLRDSERALPISDIRKRLGGRLSSQQVRRILERAPDRVVASATRPAAYSLR